MSVLLYNVFRRISKDACGITPLMARKVGTPDQKKCWGWAFCKNEIGEEQPKQAELDVLLLSSSWRVKNCCSMAMWGRGGHSIITQGQYNHMKRNCLICSFSIVSITLRLHALSTIYLFIYFLQHVSKYEELSLFCTSNDRFKKRFRLRCLCYPNSQDLALYLAAADTANWTTVPFFAWATTAMLRFDVGGGGGETKDSNDSNKIDNGLHGWIFII